MVWTSPVSAGSKMDSILAEHKPISDSGSAFVITCVRKGKNAVQRLKERSGKKRERNSPADTKVMIKEGEKGEQRFHCTTLKKPW